MTPRGRRWPLVTRTSVPQPRPSCRRYPCLSGDVSVSDSSGPVRVTTTSGDVEARNVRNLSAGDYFEATSASGDVTLEGVTHRQVTGNVVSAVPAYRDRNVSKDASLVTGTSPSDTITSPKR